MVARELSRIGIAHQTCVSKTGVVGLIKGGRPGPVLVIRADMDALPIHELTGPAFASTVANKMHACEHDIHTTTLLGVAEVLSELAMQLSGTVKLVFQPAEEAIGGMKVMLEESILEAPRVDLALGSHNQPTTRWGNSPIRAGRALRRRTRSRSRCMGFRAMPHGRIRRWTRSWRWRN